MKKLLFLISLICVSLSMTSQTTGVVFEKGTFAQALSKAKQENKNVFVDCYTQWCGPCHYMSAKVFTTAGVGTFMNPKFVCIKMDMEHGEGPALQKRFDVQAYPTFIIFNADGKEINRFSGMSLEKEFCDKVTMALQGVKNIDEEIQKSRDKQVAVAVPQEKDTIYDDGKGVVFDTISYADALAKAQKENKRIFIDCYTSWCVACKKMEKTTFRDTRVGNFMNSQFVMLKMNCETEGDGKMIAEKFNLEAFPTFLIINPDGTEFNRIIGSAPTIDFCEKVMRAAMGEEDAYVKMAREQKEALAKLKKERQSNLSAKGAAIPATKVKFEKNSDLIKALKKAKKQHRYIMAFISDDDWGAKYMADNTFQDDKVAQYLNGKFVCVFLDAKSVSGDAVMEKYNVTDSFPAYVVLDENGKLKGVDYGIWKTANVVVESLERILNYK
jgi:thiol:disulfide interchange protein